MEIAKESSILASSSVAGRQTTVKPSSLVGYVAQLGYCRTTHKMEAILDRKKIIVLFLLGFLFTASKAQWATSGTTIYNTNTGYVSLGLSAPSTQLHVNGAIRINGAPGGVIGPGSRIELASGSNTIIEENWGDSTGRDENASFKKE